MERQEGSNRVVIALVVAGLVAGAVMVGYGLVGTPAPPVDPMPGGVEALIVERTCQFVAFEGLGQVYMRCEDGFEGWLPLPFGETPEPAP